MATIEGLTISGLTAAEVAERVAQGKTNDVPSRAARSVSDIVRANVFTRINAILGVLLIIVLSTGSIINGAFGLLIIANSAVGIIQELRAKQTLDKLAIVGQTRPWCGATGRPRHWRPMRWCSTTSSNSGPATRSWWTERSSRSRPSRSTSHC
ncbi:putative cation-transporting ATPase E domain protein [Mycobacteroides abscessus MAB_030201_1075]|uniref:Putative cation-transporting ATPase E domain protein n=1 Tax=Mycobacteroides abscessus MAB_030201_1075 TaxID=1335410 RepID=A0A829PJA5_9MYCO|nr:putative cation-transporting ATPase E domain protein [Mycobacteroides abscessus MAB_030201_1075]